MGVVKLSEYFNSMRYWWPKVAELDIPKPATVIEPLEDIVEDVFRCVLSEGEDRGACSAAKEKAQTLATTLDKAVKERLGGYPVFMRTDYSSCKHYSAQVFGKPLYRIDSKEDFIKHIFPLIAECHSYIPARTPFGPPRPSAIVLREWLNIEKWTDKLPGFYGNIEVRVITKNGRVARVFPYYHRTGIEKHFSDAGPEVFEEYRERYVQAILEGLTEIVEYADKIASAPGIRRRGWSIDLALVNKDGKRVWYFIDMALAEASWAPTRETEEDRIIDTALDQLCRSVVKKYDIELVRELANSD